MAVARPILGLVAILLLAGGITMEFLVILSGLSSTPENKIFFLQANTNGISGAKNPTRWTYLALCGVENGNNANCDHTTAALPFDPPRNFGTTNGVPSQFIGTHHYYYLSRFAWAFYLVAAFFAVCAIFISLLALFARLGAYLTGLLTLIALFFQTICASLMTAWTIQGRNHFRSNGQDANLGVKAYAFTWSTWACFFIASILFCVGGSVGKTENYQKSSYFGRKRSTRSRGSFRDSENSRRHVKDEYE